MNADRLAATAPRVLVLGLGNDILTDDAIGLQVARQLRRDLADCPNVDVRETTEMGLALLDHLVGYGGALIVDAVQTGQHPPGFIHELEPSALSQLAGRTPHFLGVGETLALGRQLGQPMPETVRIFAIEVQDPFTLGEHLSAALQTALPDIAKRVGAAAREMAAPLARPPAAA